MFTHLYGERWWSAVAVLLVAMLTLSACGDSDAAGGSDSSGDTSDDAAGAGGRDGDDASAADGGDASGEPQTLTIQHYQTEAQTSGPPFMAALDDFKAANPNVTVEEVITGHDDAQEVFESNFLANGEADVLVINPTREALQWVEDGATVSVDSYVDEWGLRDIFAEPALSEPSWNTDDGQLRGFPYSGFLWPVWFNTDLLSQAGVDDVPQTVEELIAANEALRAEGIQPVTVGGSDWTGFNLMFPILQTYVSDEELGEVTTSGAFGDSESVRKGVELFVRLRDAGVFVDSVEGLDVNQMNSGFFEEQAAIMHAGSWTFPETPDALVDNVHLGGFPYPEDGIREAPVAMAGYNGIGFMITRAGAENIDAVRSYIEFMYQPEVVGTFVTDGSLVPASEAEYDESALNPLFVQALQELDSRVEFVVPSVIPDGRTEALNRATALAYVPGTSADEIIQAMEDAYQ